jgi:peptidoglycan/LPS O-acetylase OafA/YrhL
MRSPVPPTPTPQLPALTMVRGVAAWWVVLYHFRDAMPGDPDGVAGRLAAHGYLAVDLFFVLSGFVIALNYTATLAALTPGSYARFLGLRLARIYPLHLLMLLLFLLDPLAIALFAHRPIAAAQYSPLYYVLSLGLMQNWGFVGGPIWNVPAWSISTEWAAYLLFPLLARFVAPRLGSPLRALAWVGGALLLLGLIAARSVPTLGGDIARFGLFRCLAEFAAGAGICALYRQRALAARWDAGAALAGAAVLAGAYCAVPMPDYAPMPAAFALLIYALARAPQGIERLPGARLLEAVGTVSYATYMVHYFVRAWVRFLLVGHDGHAGPPALTAYLLLTAAGSVLLYRTVELPGRHALRALVNRAQRRQVTTELTA